MTTPLPTALEAAAKAIAAQNGDDLETVPTSKSHWNAEAGYFGGRFRTVNEPFRSDYEEQATAAITAYLAQMKREGSEMTPAATADLLRFVIDHYANQDMNHADFRVYAYQIAQRIVEPTDARSSAERG